MPQRRRVTAQRRMLDDLEIGDEILTLGGIFGHVLTIDEDELTVEIAPGTSIRLARRAIAAIVEPSDGEPDEPSEVDANDDLTQKT